MVYYSSPSDHLVLCDIFPLRLYNKMNLRKELYLGNIACVENSILGFYWSCSLLVMNDAMQLTPHNSMGRTFFTPPPPPIYNSWSWKTRKYDYKYLWRRITNVHVEKLHIPTIGPLPYAPTCTWNEVNKHVEYTWKVA